MSEIPEPGTSLDRRRLLGRTAAAGLLAVPGVSLLSACVGSGDDDTPDQAEGEKSSKNPLGVKEDAELEVVIFNGGLGTKYATDVHIPSYKKSFPNANVKFSQAEEISTVVQPRFAGGNPPDMVNNAGSKLMDMGALVAEGQAADLTDLFDAPSLDGEQKGQGHPAARHGRAGHVQRQAVRAAVRLHRVRPLVRQRAVQEEQLDPAEDVGRVHRAAATRSRAPASPRTRTPAPTPRTTSTW